MFALLYSYVIRHCATINAILEAGHLAPTAKNLQGQRIYVVQSAEGLAKIDALPPPCRYGAPTVLVVAYDKNSGFVFPGGKANSGEEDASIVATHMMLAETVKYLQPQTQTLLFRRMRFDFIKYCSFLCNLYTFRHLRL